MSESDGRTGQILVNDTLREFMKNSEDYIFVKDTMLIYHGSSEVFARMAGLASAAEICGKTDLELFPPDIADKYRGDDRKVLESGAPISGIVERLPDEHGRERWTKTSKYPIHDGNGMIIGLYGVSRDISGEVALREQVESAEDYIDLINHIPGGVSIFHLRDGHAYLDYANDGCLEVHHMARKDISALVGSQTMSVVYEPDRAAVLAEFDRIKDRPGAAGSVNYRTPGDDGRLHWVGFRFRTAYEKDGLPYYYGTYTGMDAQKAMEDSLAESRNALKEAMMNTDLQFFTYYPQRGRCENMMLNSRFSMLPTVWEHYPEDFLEYTKVSPSDAESYRGMIRAIDRGDDHAECTVRFAYNGGYIWERISITAVRDSEGKVVRGQGYSVNITERKTAEERIRRERLRLKTMENGVFESFSFDLTKASDPEIRTSDREMKGPVSEQILKEALELCPPLKATNPATRDILLLAAMRIPDAADRKIFITTCSGEAVLTAAREGHFFKTIRYRRQVNGEIRWVSTSAEVLPDPESGDLFAFYYTSDINDEIIREKVSSNIVQRNYACVSILNLSSGIYSVLSGTDEHLRPLSGMRYTDALEKAEKDFVAECDAEQYRQELSLASITAALEESRLYTVYNRRSQTAEQLPGKPLRRMKNDIFYLDEHRDVLVFLLTDVTEIYEQEREAREKLETALIAAKQASSAKSNFLSRMSHEIRTPLNGIIGMDTIAAQSVDNPEKVADCVAKIGLSARYLLSLINDILDMSRIESGKMLLKNEKFLFSDLISGINTMIYNQTKSKGLDYECIVSSEISEAYVGDVMKLQQVLLNILGNAVKFTKTGKITLDIRPVSGKGNHSVVRFVVNDTGIGIREDHLEKIFSPFEQEDTTTTTVFGGTGLGLAITKNLVNLMGGSIGVRSIVGIGSEFTVDVPLTIDESVFVQPASDLHFDKMSALVVDDDLIVCEQTERILRDIGMTGEWVTSGAEAVSRVRANHEKSVYYNYILIDWKMPDMDGLETTRAIRRIVGPDVTIIIISAYDWESIELEAKAAGANLLISKPLLKNSLISAFQRTRGQEEPKALENRTFDFTGRRVLVAEDNQINSEIAKTLLEEKNFTVETTVNGLKAMELFLKNPAGYYDAILMDIRMPLMDGLQAAVNIRHCDKPDAKTVPIIAMTANAFDEDVERSRAAGMNAHLSKPIDPEYMYVVLDHVINHP
jgi:PAS domain S-box-containing protein